jgi:hypothetical protein
MELIREGWASAGLSALIRLLRSSGVSAETLCRLAGCDSHCLGRPFDLGQVADYLRHERYITGYEHQFIQNRLRSLYYHMRPLLPKRVRQCIQRVYFRCRAQPRFPNWPVDTTVECLYEATLRQLLRYGGIAEIPFIWFWPEGYSGACILTHDVETRAGQDFCGHVMDVEDAAGVRSSFQLIPEGRYKLSPAFLASIRDRGFEIGIHDFNHDGRLFDHRQQFLRRVKKINGYARDFGAKGFRSAILYRRLDWFKALEFSYDMSVPNTGHLEVQKGGCCTVFPYFIGNILELPLTTVQDYVLFEIFRDHSLALWKRQAELILANNGLVNFLVHPDYIREPRAEAAYRLLLEHINQMHLQQNVWVALPGEVETWWRQRSRMELVADGARWRIQGVGQERARVAYARLKQDRLVVNISKCKATDHVST